MSGELARAERCGRHRPLRAARVVRRCVPAWRAKSAFHTSLMDVFSHLLEHP
ncbi:hypothetical protein [Lysobacter gummosus]|uniref:hypothetical protein n=1 Tax=Lysobacter gummosus TaxID=262324 RepID=UPI003627C154